MKEKSFRHAPKNVFQKILQRAVIPSFDLLVWGDGKGAVLVKRKPARDKDTWALPGLRMMKPEGIEDALVTVAQNEIGIAIAPAKRVFIG